MNDDPSLAHGDVVDAVPITHHAPLTANHSPGLSRAVHATASPRRGLALDGYERVGARRERRRLAVGALSVALGLLVLALFYLWELHYASGYTYAHWGPLGPHAGNDYDEGAYVISAQLLLRGFPLFHSVFSAQPAFFLPSLAAVINAVGNPVAGGHVYEALCGLAVLADVFWMAWLAYRPLAAPLAAALLAVSPGFLLYAHAVEAEMPMLALCTLSVAAAQTYYQTRRRSMAALSGLLFMAGTEIKLLSPVLALPVALLLLGGAWTGYRAGRTRRAITLDALAFVLCLVVPALLVLALLSPGDQFRQVVTFHLAASRVLPRDLKQNLHELAVFLRYDPGLLLAAAAGVVLGLLRPRGRYLTLVYLLWFLVTLVFLYLYHPLLQHQFIPLLPPLALLGASLAGVAGRRFNTEARRHGEMAPDGHGTRGLVGRGPLAERGAWGLAGRGTSSPAAHGSMAVRAEAFSPANKGLLARVTPWATVVVAVAYLGMLGFRTVPIDRHIFARPVEPHRALLIAWLDRNTRPGDFVVADDPMVALEAHRLLPPGLEDPSMVRTIAGYLTPTEAEAATLRYHAAAIVASRPMFAPLLPSYLTWAARAYRQVPSLVAGAQLFLRR